MTSALGIGWRPEFVDVNLNKGDWLWEDHRPGGLPDGTTAWIVFSNGVRFDAVIDPTEGTVAFRQTADKVTPTAVPDGSTFDMFLRYPAQDDYPVETFHWKSGRVRRDPPPSQPYYRTTAN